MSSHLAPLTPSPKSSHDTNATGLVFFPQPDPAPCEGVEDSQDYFGSASCPSPAPSSSISPSQNFAWNARRLSFGDRSRPPFFSLDPGLDLELDIGLGLGPGGVERLPDEPEYPPSIPPQAAAMTATSSPTRPLLLQDTVRPSSSNKMSSSVASLHTIQGDEHKPNKKPFGRTFLAPSPTIVALSVPDSDPSKSAIKRQLTPLVPVGFVSPPRPTGAAPSSHLTKAAAQSAQSASLKGNLSRTDSATLYPSLSISRRLGHARRDSGDSQRTVRPTDGLKPDIHGASQAASQTPPGSRIEARHLDHTVSIIQQQGKADDIGPCHTKYSSEGTYVPPRRPATNRFASQGSGGLPLRPRLDQDSSTKLRSYSMSAPFQRHTGASSSPLARPTSPLAHQSYSYSGDGRGSLQPLTPRDRLPVEEGLVHFPFPTDPTPAGEVVRPVSPASASRFKRPISPSFPNDSFSPYLSGQHTHINPHTHSHQTLSSAPKRPKSPTTARESLKVVLARNTELALRKGEDDDNDDDDDDRRDSLDRLVHVAQKAEYGSVPFYHPHPPSHLSTRREPLRLPSSTTSLPVRSASPFSYHHPHQLRRNQEIGSGRPLSRHQHTTLTITDSDPPLRTNVNVSGTIVPIRPKPRKGFTLSSLFSQSPPHNLHQQQQQYQAKPTLLPPHRPETSSPPQTNEDLPTPPENSPVSPPPDVVDLGYSDHYPHQRFDVNKISETLRGMTGRVSFAEVEGLSHPGDAFADGLNNHELEVEHEDQREIARVGGVNPLSKQRRNHSRPGSGSRRWTLPF
ncbi:hypothetical protein IAU59_006057 [Kwoniella sp. CBS 9459]